jgi:hypothetical protein
MIDTRIIIENKIEKKKMILLKVLLLLLLLYFLMFNLLLLGFQAFNGRTNSSGMNIENSEVLWSEYRLSFVDEYLCVVGELESDVLRAEDLSLPLGVTTLEDSAEMGARESQVYTAERCFYN